MKNKQTPVQWLHLEFQKRFPKQTSEMYENNQLDYEDVIIKAKAMEKEHIKDAWLSGQDDGATICTPNQHYPDEDYYNETYKQQDNNE